MKSLFLIVLAAFGAEPATTAQEQLRRVPVQLVINEVPRQQVVVRLGDDTIWVPVAALEAAGLRDFDGDRSDFAGAEFVELGSLAPDIVGGIEMADVSLRITAAPRFFALNDIGIVDPRPRGLVYARTTSAHLNYAVNWNSDAGADFFGEASFSFAGNSLSSTFTVGGDGSFRRGFTTLTFDQPAAMRRWVIGDTSSRAGLLGNSPLVGGVRIGREYSLDPYYVRYATPLYSGTVATPSTVEIFVDGQPGQRFTLPPGPFEVGRLPVSGGLGSVQVVVRDAFGREQLFDSRYYLSTEVLKRGEQDYDYLAGFERIDGIDGPRYDRPLGTARHRFGITDGFTLGYRLEAGEDIVNGGPTINLLLGQFGETELYVAASSGADRVGYAAAATYAFVTRGFSASAFVRWRNDDYGDLFLSPTQPRDDLLLDAVASVPLFGRGSLSAGIRRSEVVRVDGPDGPIFIPPGLGEIEGEDVVLRAATVRASFRIAPRIQLLGVATRNDTGEEGWWTGSVSLSVAIGRRTAATVARDWGNDGKGIDRVDVNRSLSIGPGIGYRVSATTANDGFGLAELDGQTRFARAFVQYDVRRGEPGFYNANVAGSIVAIGRNFALSRPIDAGAGFAMVKLPESPGVEVFANNQPVGRTNRNGNLFVPDLLPYHANNLRFDDTEVSLDMVVARNSEEIAPPFRGGPIIEFPISRLRAFNGTVLLVRGDETIVPEYGDFNVDGPSGTARSPLTRSGHFYLEDLEPGSWPAWVLFAGERCEFDLQVPDTDQRITDLGTLRCELR